MHMRSAKWASLSQGARHSWFGAQEQLTEGRVQQVLSQTQSRQRSSPRLRPTRPPKRLLAHLRRPATSRGHACAQRRLQLAVGRGDLRACAP